MRPCLHCRKPLARGQRCSCRGTKTRRGYGPSYQQARAELLATKPACHWCHTKPATTADHVPPLRRYRNPSEWDGTLVPSCSDCQTTHIPERDT